MVKLLQKKELLLLTLVTLLLLLHIPDVMDGVRSALLLCARSVIPSLLVFMVLSDCITALVLEKESLVRHAKWVAFILGAVCGFPVGAVVCETLVCRGAISKEDAERLLPFCNNASPAFVLGVVGNGLYGDLRMGALVFFAQFFVAFCMVLSVKSAPCTFVMPPVDSLKTLFLNAVEKTASSVLRITVLVSFFSAILSVARRYMSSSAFAFSSAFLEIGNGVAATTAIPQPYGFALCGFACGWSGLCVLLQVLFASRSIKVKTKRYVLSKALQGVLTAFLTLVLYKFLLDT